MRNALAALVAALLVSAPLAAYAQIPPSYSGSGYGRAGEAQIRGRILTFDGAYDVRVRDENGYVDRIRLHQGTVINPTGLTLAPGMIVSIIGYNAGSFFAANEVDTPYTFNYGRPYYGGHPWNYYGPGVSLGFFFGDTGWWHESRFDGMRYDHDGDAYPFYRGGGNVDGRNYGDGRNDGTPHQRGWDGYGGAQQPVDNGRRYREADRANAPARGAAPARAAAPDRPAAPDRGAAPAPDNRAGAARGGERRDNRGGQ
jgi:hypothetical protein